MCEESWLNRIDDSMVKSFFLNQSNIEKKEGFNTALSFGTAGIRGKFGLGEGRLNRFTVQKVALGIANYVVNELENKQAVIHYDTRHLSKEFAEIIANTLSQYKIKVYMPDTYKTTPELSYSVRYLKTGIGIMITASHNPRNYNGIKVYGSDGAQLSTDDSDKLSEYINKLGNSLIVDNEFNFESNSEFIKTLPIDVTNNYFEQIIELVGHIPKSDLKLVFSSLHGTSVPVVPQLLNQLKFNNYYLVENQCKPDPDFNSVDSANPEDKRAFKQAIDLANKINANLIICTDPDADRLGIVERDDNGDIHHFNGNEIGALLLNYRIRQTKHLKNRLMIQSIVSSELAKDLAEFYGIQSKEVLTGFKYIAKELKDLHEENNFILGYEESYGFLASDFVRDKDAIQIVPLLISYASELKNNNRTLFQELDEIYQNVGYRKDNLYSNTFEGLEGKKKILKIMDRMSVPTLTTIAGLEIQKIENYETGMRYFIKEHVKEPIELPKAKLIKIYFKEGFIALRPSGTEPKIKLYVSLKVKDFDKVAESINNEIFEL